MAAKRPDKSPDAKKPPITKVAVQPINDRLVL